VCNVYVYMFYRVQEELAQYTGRQLFNMSKVSLERMFGADEGGRLYSQLLVQKNLSGVRFTIFLFFCDLSFISLDVCINCVKQLRDVYGCQE